MNIIYLLVFGCLGLGLLIVHSYFTRGFRLTLNFFLFAFIAGIRKESGTFLIASGAPTKFPSPFEHTTGYPPVVSVLITTMGWMLAFYLSWWMAERIVARTGRFRGRLFPVLLFACGIVAALSYAIEATAINAHWWRWMFFDERFRHFFYGHVHFFALKAWFFVALPFLAAFFLIECSRYRTAPWKCVFFLIPVTRLNVMLFFGPHNPSKLYEELAFLLLVFLALLSPLRLEYPARPKARSVPGFVANIPGAVLAMIIAFLAFADMVKIKNPGLLACIVPLAVFGLMTLRQARAVLLVPMLLALWAAGGQYAVPALIPALCFLTFAAIGKLPWQKPYSYR